MKEQGSAEVLEQFPSTKPKPLVFVLMPFDSEFDDVYELGIKAAIQEAGGHAERLDEQIFTESMLERIYSQIAKADVVVADMTGRNANVFYEVGYAHAMDKVVLLLTRQAEDIPFDLKHHPHLVYEGRIKDLKAELSRRVAWALKDASRPKSERAERLIISHGDTILATSTEPADWPDVKAVGPSQRCRAAFLLENAGFERPISLTKLLLFTESDACLVPEARSSVVRRGVAPLGFVTCYWLPFDTMIPPGGIDEEVITFSQRGSSVQPHAFCLRVQTNEQALDFFFRLVPPG